MAIAVAPQEPKRENDSQWPERASLVGAVIVLALFLGFMIWRVATWLF